MKLLPFQLSNTEEIKQLFIKVFSDAEGQSEGMVIGNLTSDIMTITDTQDLYGFIATENEHIIGSIFWLFRTYWKR